MKSPPPAAARKRPAAKTALAPDGQAEWDLCLYVLGQSPRSVTAIANLQKLCQKHMLGKYRVEVIDLLKTPQLSRDHQIVAIPTLVRKLPAPIVRMIGDLSDTESTLVGLQIKPSARKGTTRR